MYKSYITDFQFICKVKPDIFIVKEEVVVVNIQQDLSLL